MHYPTLFSSTSVFLALHVGLGNCSPRNLPRAAVPCDDISKYTTEYFMKSKIFNPPVSTCLFYTAGLSGTAQRYAHGGGQDLTTIWDMWSCDLYNGNTADDQNPLRCIFSDDKNRVTYFEKMSEAMAISCDVAATVMTKDVNNIPQDGIWGRIEFPALKRTGNPGGTVDTVTAIDPSGNNAQTIWIRVAGIDPTITATPIVSGGVFPTQLARRQRRDDDSDAVVKRDDQPNGCLSPDQIDKWFGDIPW